jgi:hypothetical protein
MTVKRWQQERDDEIDSDPVPKQAAKPKNPKSHKRGQTFTAPDYSDVVMYDAGRVPVMNVSHDV